MSDEGRWSEDGKSYVYDFTKISEETGWTKEEVEEKGARFCLLHPKKGEVNFFNPELWWP